MGTTYDAKRRETDDDGKAHWEDAGYKVIEYERDGERRLLLKDGRTGEMYSLFPRKPRSDAGPETW